MTRKLLLSAAPDQATLEFLISKVFDSKVVSVEPAGTGMLGYVFRVKLAGDPHQVVVKWQKYSGKAEPETKQLNLLRQFAGEVVPKVFYVHKGSKDLPYEAMIMETLPGIQASSLKDPSMDVQEQIAEEIIDLLLRWHSVGHPQGYGPLEGPYIEKWADYQKSLAEKHLAEVVSLHPGDSLPPVILETAHRSIEAVTDIMGDVSENAVLVHGDIWLPNILIDPETYHVTGIVDPQNCRWDEREADVVPMDWPYGDYQFLMNVYQRKCPLREGWPLRFAYQRFWFMMEAMYLIGPDSAKGEAENLKKLMDESLGNS